MTVYPCAVFAQSVNNIVPDGRTATTVTNTGNTSTVTTSTVSGPNAFNSFSQFTIGAGGTGNLILPSGTSNLINLMSTNNPFVVNGVLNAYRNGQIGGNVYFASSGGFIVGSGGVVNVGQLHVTTPTREFIDGVIGAGGQINQGSVNNLLAGTVPLSPDGNIRIRGKINAAEAVRLIGQNVTIGGPRDLANLNHAARFASTVNAKGLQSASGVVVRNGSIQIVAGNSAKVNGRLTARKDGGQGGDIVVTANGAIRIGGAANLNARGKDGDGGNIIVRAGTSLTVDNGANFNVSSVGAAAGLVELSSNGTFHFAPNFKVNLGGANGRNGVLLTDPDNIVVGSTADGDTGVTLENSDIQNVINAIVGGGTYKLPAGSNADGGSITIAAHGKIIGSKLDASGHSIADSVNIELDAANITVLGTIDARATAGSGFADGNITINAISTPTNTIAGLNTASASITIGSGAQLLGGNITLQSTAAATSSYTDSAASFAALIAQSQGAALVGLNGGYVAGTSTATVAVNGGTINGSGKVLIAASGNEKASDPVITLGSSSPASIAVVVGEINGTVSAKIASGASITAGSDLTIKATNDATLNVSAIGFTTDSATVDTVALGFANVQTTASVAHGATLSVGGSLAVVATNTNDFTVGATALAGTNGKSGIAVAYNNNSTNAIANLSADLGTSASPVSGNVTVEANSIGKNNATSAAAIAGNPPLVVLASQPKGPIKDFLAQKVDGKAADKLKTAGAAAVTLSSQAANASIAADSGEVAPSVYTAGDVAVVSRVVDAGVRSNADASTSSQNPTAATKGQTTAANAIAAGVAVGQFEHNSNAFIGSDVTISAKDVGVSASTSMPITITWATYDSVGTWLGKMNGNLGVVNQVLTSYANAASTATGLDIAGAVNYFQVDNTTTAWVGSSSSVNSTNVSLLPWSTTLNDLSTISWAQNIAVLATTRTESVNIGGNFSWIGITGTGGQTLPNGQTDTTAIGGSANAILYNNRTVAGVGSNATVTASGAVGVNASNTDLIFSVAPTAGTGAGDAFNGIIDLALVDDFTHASIANSARVTASILNLNAADAVSILAVSGAITSSQNNGVGLVVAVNKVSGDTAAYIGANGTDLSQGNNKTDDIFAIGNLGGGYAHVDTLTVEAQTYGIVQTVSVAATVASSSPSSGSSFLGKFLDFTGLDPYSGKAAAKAANAAGGTTPPKWSIDISGSSSVNLASMATSAYLDGVTVTGLNPNSSNTTLVQGVNNLVLTAASGSAALDFATNPATKSAAVAGALSISITTNTTTAYIANSSISKSAGVSVLALAGGEQTTVAIGLAINESANQNSAASAAGSISLSFVNDGVSAYILNSNIAIDPTLAGALTYNNAAVVAAYQTTDIGIGGGALYFGGKTGFGFAFTYAEIGNPTNGLAVDAHVSNSSITDFYSASVIASDASRIGAGAGLFGYARNALAVSLVVSDISPTISAVVDGGTTPGGSSTITVSGAPQSFVTTAYRLTTTSQQTDTADTDYTLIYTVQSLNDPTVTYYTYNVTHTDLTTPLRGDVTVASNGNRNAAFDTAISAASQTGGGLVSANLIDFSGSSIEAANSTSGSSITAVAGVVQGGQNSVGFSITASSIHQSNIANIIHSNVTSNNGDVIVAADNSANILGVAVGVALTTGKFAGLASSSINLIDNTVSATIGGPTATTADTFVKAVNVTVQATDDSNIRGAAGSLAIGLGKAAVGLSVTYDDIANSVTAGINSAKVQASENVTVNAQSDADALNVAVGIALSKDVGIAGSVAVNVLETNVAASISNGADVDARNNVAVIAGNSDTVQVLAGALGIGKNGVGIGLSVVVNEVSGVTSASISGAATKVDARGIGNTGALTVNNGRLLNPFDVSTADNPSLSSPDLTETTRNVRGLAVVSTSQQSIVGDAITVGVDLDFITGAALALVPVTSLMGGTTTANIDGAQIDTRLLAGQTPQVYVGASSVTYSRNFVLAVALSGGLSGSGSINSNQLDRTTTAYIKDANVGTATNAVSNVEVDAISTQVSSTIAIGGAAGLLGGGAGSIIVNVFSADTEAYVVHGNMYASDLSVIARSDDGYFAAGGAGAAGSAGAIAGAFVIGASQNTTIAYIGDQSAPTNITLSGDLDVHAISNNTFYSFAVGASGAGGNAIAGTLSVTVINNHTQALIQNVTDTQTTTGGSDVTVDATENLTLRPMAGAGAAGGDIGVGASINVVALRSQVASGIVDSDVNVTGSVNVTSLSNKDISGRTVTVGIGGTVGIAASIAVIVAGSGTPGDAVSQMNGSVSSADGAAADPSNGIMATDVPGANNPAPARPASYSVANALGSGSDAVTAEITGGRTTANYVNVSATAKVETTSLSVGAAVGTVGVGAALGYTLVYDTVAASVNGDVTAPVVSVSAAMQDGGGRAAEVDAYAGAGALTAAVGAGIAIATLNNTVSATIGGKVTGPGVNSGSTGVTVTASDGSSVKTQVFGVAVGGGVSAGISSANSTKSSLVYAAAVERSVIAGYATMSVIAQSSGAVDSESRAGAGGIFAGLVGAGATSVDSENVIAEIGTVEISKALNEAPPAPTLARASITVGAGGLTVKASATPDTSADAVGVAVGSVGVGGSVALATVDATIGAYVDAKSSIVTPGTLTVKANSFVPVNDYSAYATAVAGTGGFLFGANATDSEATNNSTVIAAIANDAAVGDTTTLPVGSVSVQATNNTNQSAFTTGVSVGYIAIGVDLSFATANTTTKAIIGNSVTSSTTRTGNLLLSAQGNDSNKATSIAGVGGVYAGSGAGATTTNNSSVLVKIGDSSSIVAGTIGITAWHTSTYQTSVDSVNASLVGASGAVGETDIGSDVKVDIGVNVHLLALQNACGNSTCLDAVSIVAQNAFVSGGGGSTTWGAGGGAFNAAAAFNVIHITGNTSIVLEDTTGTGADLAHKTIIAAGTDPFNNPGGIRMVAFTTYDGASTVQLTTGGAITVAGVNSSTTATFNNTVTIGTNDILTTFGSIGIGTFTEAAVTSQTYASTFGIAAVGSAGTFITLANNETVTVKSGALLSGFGNIDLTPGQDPRGTYQTVLVAVTADAEAYVRGLIAIPTATAKTDLTSTASLLVDTGATVTAGQNVTLGAYTGSPDFQVDGTGHGYFFFFIPATNHDSQHPHTETSTVTLASGSTVTAGYYHDQEVTIDCGASACGANSIPTVQASGAPLTWIDNTAPNNLFNAAAYVGNKYDGDVAPTLLLSIANTDVPAFQFSTLYASAGSVTINAGNLVGSGTVTAYGSPIINVVANTPTYLVFAGAYIPNLIGGQVNFTGQVARSAVPAGMTINEIGAGGTPKIKIVNNYIGQTGSTGHGPAMLFDGDVTNLGGTILITNISGSYGSLGNTNAQGVELNVPNGAAVISNPAPGGYYGSGIANFNGLVLYPGGTPTVPIAQLDANVGAEYVANAVLQPYLGTLGSTLSEIAYGTAIEGTQHFPLSRVGVPLANLTPDELTRLHTTTLFFSNCIAGYSGACTTTPSYQLLFDSSGANGQYIFGNFSTTGTGFADYQAYLYKQIPQHALTYENSAAPTGSTAVKTFGGGNVAIKAAIIDVNAKIVIGRPTVQSIVIPSSVQTQLSNDLADYNSKVAAGQAPDGIYDITGTALLSRLDAATQGVGTAYYNAKTNQIIVTDTNASSSGGHLTMIGAIVSTSTVGNIQVNGGLGQVTINNQTNIPMVVNKVNTGVTSSSGAVVSTVVISDTLRPDPFATTTFVFTAGQGVSTYITPRGVDAVYSGPNAMQPAGTSAISASGSVQLGYTPEFGARLVWVQEAQLQRDASATSTSPGTWSWVTGSDANNPWMFVSGAALTAPGYSANTYTSDVVSQAHPQAVVLKPGDPGYVASTATLSETITGGITTYASQSGTYNYSYSGQKGLVLGTGIDFASACGCNSNDGDATTRTVNIPTLMWLKLTTSVKADNPIGISFNGGNVGSVNVTSKAAVTFADTFTNSTGVATVTAKGSITQAPNTFFQTKSLVLDATDGLGAAANNATSGIGIAGSTPFAATINGGTVAATAGSGGVNMSITGTATTGKIIAQDSKGYGNIVYTEVGDLLPATGGSAVPINFIGKDITLTSVGGVIGALAAPIVISANSTTDNNGVVSGGVVNMTAQGDINFTQTSTTPGQRLDLRLGTVSSLSGDVIITVAKGALVDSRGQTAASTLKSDQVDAVIARLGLSTGQDATTNTIAPFEARVTNDYTRYYRFKNDSCSANCTPFDVSSALVLYRPLATAALKNPNLTDAQVMDYVTQLHQANGTLNLSDSALAIYRPLAQGAIGGATPVTDAQVRAYADAQYQGVASDFAQAYGSNWASLSRFTGPATVAGYKFTVNDADAAPGLMASLTARSVWDPAQVVAAIDQTAFQPVSPTVGNGTANITGRNVTLHVGGDAGLLAAPVSININSLIDGANGPTLTTAQKAAIAAASSPGAVVAVGVDAQGNVVKGFSLSSVPAGVTITGVEIGQQAPIFITATGVLNADATAAAFIQSTGLPNLKIGQVVAGGDVALTAAKGLLVATNNNGVPLFAQQVLAGGNVTLSAGGGDIGGNGLPVSYKADGHLTAAQASGNVYVASYGGYTTQGGDMTVGRVFADGTASLTSVTGGIKGYLGGVVISAHDIILVASNGDIGSDVTPLQVQTNGGQLTGTASGAAYLFSPIVSGQAPVALNVASLSANGPVSIVADFDLTVQNATSATGSVNIGAGGNGKVLGATASASSGNGTVTVTALGDLEVGSLSGPGGIVAHANNGVLTIDADKTLKSLNGAVDILADSLAMQALSGVSAAGIITVTTTHDAVLGKLDSQFAPAALNTVAVAVTAGDATHVGQILGNGDGQVNITTVRPNTLLTLASSAGIGTAATPIVVNVPAIAANTIAGGVHVAALGNIRVLSASGTGDIDLSGTGSIGFSNMKGDKLILKANGTLDVDNIEVMSSIVLQGTIISGNVRQTPGAPGALRVTITGPNGTVADTLNLDIDPLVTIIPQLAVIDAHINNVGPSVTIENGLVLGQLTLTMLGQTYVMNNRSPSPIGGATVQLYQFGAAPFYFSQINNVTYTSGFIVNYGPFADVTALSAFRGMSFTRDAPQMMWSGNPFTNDPEDSRREFGFRPLGKSAAKRLEGFQLPKAVEVVGNGPAVNIGGLR